MSEKNSQEKGWNTENIYTRVVIAAHEARRLNAERVMRESDDDGKVTTEAIRRADEGAVEWEIALEDDEPAVGEITPEKTAEEHSVEN